MMNIREKTYTELRKRVALKKEERAAVLSRLREDEYFDGLMRSANSLRWDCVLLPDEEKVTAKEKLDLTEQKIKEYIKKNGYTEDILYDTESCSLCHDTGVYQGRMCRCADEIRKELSLVRSPMLKDLPDSLSDVDTSFYGEAESMYKKYLSFLKKKVVPGEINFTVIGGKTGTGKSYLGCAVARECLTNGDDVLAVSALKLNQVFLSYHCAFLEAKQDIWQEIVEPDLLYIDDLGVEPILNNVTKTYLYALLVERMDKKTVITTNLDIVQLEERYGERIISRLLDKRKGAMMTFEGKDLRF